MTDGEIELQAQIDGLKLVLGVLIDSRSVDRHDMVERLRILEEKARRDNMLSGTIQILREMRERLE